MPHDDFVRVAGVSLVVLRCADVVAARRFYEAIGLALRAEKHGAGPEHWSARAGDTVIELYPASGGVTTVGRLGLRVADVRDCLRALAEIGAPIDRPFDPSTGVAVVIDPDGTKVELCQTVQRSTWAIWRQDDNGNRFRISGGHAHEDAERTRAAFEARGHKQLYWIEPEGTGASR